MTKIIMAENQIKIAKKQTKEQTLATEKTKILAQITKMEIMKAKGTVTKIKTVTRLHKAINTS